MHLLFLFLVAGGGVMEEHIVEVGGIGVENVLANEFESHFNHIAYILEAVLYGKIFVYMVLKSAV